MNASDRRALRSLGREHLAAFERESARIEATLRTILGGSDQSHDPGQDRTGLRREGVTYPTEWQAAAEELLSTARRVEALLAVVLGVAPGDRAADNADRK